MRNLALTLLCALTLLFGAPALTAQSLDSFDLAGTVLDPTTLAADGWTEASPGLWTRSPGTGIVQKLAFGEGRLELVSRLQKELDRLTREVGVDPRPELFEAMDQLVGTLAEIHDRPQARLETRKAAPPPGCYPHNLETTMSTWVYPPPGGHGITASAWASWDGNGLNCPGHIYTRAERSYFSTTHGLQYELDYCTIDNQWSGSCWALTGYPWTVPLETLTSCSAEAYAYMTVYYGAVVLTEEKELNSCF